MKVQWGINHIQNLKEVGKSIPKNLNEIDLEPDSDGDYRCQAVSWAEKIFNEVEQKVYENYVKERTPTKNLFLQMLKAFLTGGTICLIGQIISDSLSKWLELPKDTAT